MNWQFSMIRPRESLISIYFPSSSAISNIKQKGYYMLLFTICIWQIVLGTGNINNIRSQRRHFCCCRFWNKISHSYYFWPTYILSIRSIQTWSREKFVSSVQEVQFGLPLFGLIYALILKKKISNGLRKQWRIWHNHSRTS